MNIGQSILFLVLGWLLGLLGPVIVDEIRRRRQAARIKSAIVSELTEVRLKLAFTAHTLAMRFGTWDRALLEWVKPIMDGYSGPHTDAGVAKEPLTNN